MNLMNTFLAVKLQASNDDVIPFPSQRDGYFTAHAVVLGIHTVYVFAGELGDEAARIIGRTEYQGDSGFVTYMGEGIKGGHWKNRLSIDELIEAHAKEAAK